MRALKNIKLMTGFTVVELLITIVVIGLVATITVVAYNGVQNRSRDAVYVSSVSVWEKLFRLEFNLTRKIPGVTENVPFCLGNSVNNFPVVTGKFTAGQCDYQQSGSTTTIRSYNQSIIDQFRTKTDFPNGNLPMFDVAVAGGVTIRARAVAAYVTYNSANESYDVSLYWKNSKPGTCPKGTDAGQSQTPSPTIATCVRTLTFK